MPVSGTESARRKINFIEQIKKGSVNTNIKDKDIVYCLQAIRILTPDEVRSRYRYIRRLLKKWFNMHYSSSDQVAAGHIRRSICWVDEALYMEEE